MPKSKFVDFKAIKAAVTMEQVLQHYGLLESMKRSGDSLSGCCPIHNGTNPTQFRVSVSKNVWNCFSECKHGGNVLDFVAEKEGISVHAAAIKLGEWFDLPDADAQAEDESPREASAPGSPRHRHPRPRKRSSSPRTARPIRRSSSVWNTSTASTHTSPSAA